MRIWCGKSGPEAIAKLKPSCCTAWLRAFDCMAYALLRDEHPSEDLTQPVPITTLEALRAGRLREPEKLASFVLGTCRMTVLDLRRSSQRKERLLEQFGRDLHGVGRMSIDLLDHDKLQSCVQNLRERERAVVVMTFYHEQTGADVASFLNVSEENVRVIRHRAIRQLRECIGGTV